jgi:predicted DNA-binding protein
MTFAATAAACQGLLPQEPTLSKTHIVFVYAGDLWSVQRAGGEATRFTVSADLESNPRFSPGRALLHRKGLGDGPSGGGCELEGGEDRNRIGRGYAELPSIAILSETDYAQSMGTMKGITVKFPEKTLQQLRQRARRSGRSVSALIRELVEREPEKGETVYAMTADLAGILEGRNEAATNARRKFRR